MSRAREETHLGDRAPSGRAVILLGHGSREEEANGLLRNTAGALEAMKTFGPVVAAFLDLAEPGLRAAAEALIGRGFADITVMPYFLCTGIHLKRDIPAEIDLLRRRYPGLVMRLARPLGSHEKMLDIVAERISEALTNHG